MRRTDLAIVIPTHGRWEILQRTLSALEPQADDVDVIVVVDGLDLEPPDLALGRIEQVPHGGPGRARNHGVAVTDRAVVLLLGDDMVPTPGLVDAHLQRHTAEPATDVAVLGRVDWHPDVADNRVLRWLDWSGTQFEYGAIEEQAEPDIGFARFYSCNVSLKRDLFEAAGGFDPEFVYYYEDLDFGWRLGEKGMVLRYAPDAVAHHFHSYDLPDVVRRFEGIAVGERMMADKHAWFTPFFRSRVLSVAHRPPTSRLWTRVADSSALATTRVGRRARREANRWYLQHVGSRFLESWYRDLELAELEEYLGDRFDRDRLIDHVAQVEREERAAPDDETFYRTSTAYLYDLTAFAMSGTKAPYRSDLRRLVPPGSSLLDYGCGIGSDGLRLLDEGYDVAFADYDNPSTQYLRWRLDRRGVSAPVYDVEATVPGGHDLVYCFDVIEHIDDPIGFLERLESLASVVLVNLLEVGEHDTHVHKPLDVAGLVDRAADRGLVHYRRYHGRSHLLAYRGTSTTSPLERWQGRARVAAVRRSVDGDPMPPPLRRVLR